MVGYKRECTFVERLLYATDPDGSIYTLPGFYKDIVGLANKNMDTVETVDIRTKMPDPDWEAVKRIRLRDYQLQPAVDMIFGGMEDGGVINATGGFGICNYLPLNEVTR